MSVSPNSCVRYRKRASQIVYADLLTKATKVIRSSARVSYSVDQVSVHATDLYRETCLPGFERCKISVFWQLVFPEQSSSPDDSEVLQEESQVSAFQKPFSLRPHLGVHLVFGGVGCDPRQVLKDNTECVLMNRRKFGQFRSDSRKIATDVKLSVFRISLPFMLREWEDGLGQLSAILLEYRRYREDVMLLHGKLESFFV